MSILLAYLDHRTADIAVREKLSFTDSGVQQAVMNIKNIDGVSGAVLLSTCNRTELYLSCSDKQDADAARILCREAGAEPEGMTGAIKTASGVEAIRHLMEVACGLRSMILCEDQIITQVKSAIALSREVKAADAVLETMFRLAATVAKKAKTNVKISAVPTSAAEQAVRLLEKKFGLLGRRALVIGNGEMGRICAAKLVEAGADVTVTLRVYKHGETVVPFGCKTIAYDRRAELFPECDLVVSATRSPHCTVTADMVAPLSEKPLCFVDLALPRDIEPQVEDIEGVCCFNIDSLGGIPEDENAQALAQIHDIIDEYIEQFFHWNRMHLKAQRARRISI